MAADEATFSVLGLHCPSCARRLEALLGAARGVASAHVDFLRATVLVRAHAPASSAPLEPPLAPGEPPLDPGALVALADQAGFRLALRPDIQSG